MDEIEITGRRKGTDSFTVRIEKDESDILKLCADDCECTCADILRTAWKDFIVKNNLIKKYEK